MAVSPRCIKRKKATDFFLLLFGHGVDLDNRGKWQEREPKFKMKEKFAKQVICYCVDIKCTLVYYLYLIFKLCMHPFKRFYIRGHATGVQ